MELVLSLKSSEKVPLYKQMYGQIRDAITSGRLRPSDKLPSTRELSDRLELSRNTVNLAYERLLSEGYLEGRRGSGTYVTNLFPEIIRGKREDLRGIEEPVSLPQWTRDLEKWVYAPPALALPYDFRPGMPALEHFPTAIWRRIIRRQLHHLAPELARYGDPAGYRPLREAIAAYLRRSRAVVCDPDRVVVTAGSQQALDLLARLHLIPGKRVVLENPSYPAAVAAFRAAGATLFPVAVDDEGIQTERLPQNAQIVYVTPSHQYPTGVVLSLARRLALLDWARKHRAVVIEDDYDCEFRYGGRAIESLQGLDRSGLVIYVGTFSKVLFPTLRLGYVVLPRSLVKPFVALKWISDRHTAGLEQRFLADFVLEGYFERYLRKMRNVYEERRQVLLRSLAEYAGDYITVAPSLAGLHLTGWIRGKFDENRLKSRAAELGVGLYPLTPYYLEKPRPGLLFGYSGISTADIRKGVRRLGQILAGLA
jgi:GntR family transcriptional regulator/MocR family aminotransferase